MEEEICTNGCNWGGGYTTIRYCDNCGEPRYNIYICKKDEEISNIYSSNWFELIFGVVVD